jgi:hypothetical protein
MADRNQERWFHNFNEDNDIIYSKARFGINVTAANLTRFGSTCVELC